MWEFVQTFAVGGLENVGFVPETDLLLVVSAHGRGLFDCWKGEKLARDPDSSLAVFNDESGEVEGFASLAGRKIKTHGLFGGDRLPKTTRDGWLLSHENESPFEDGEINVVTLYSPDKTTGTFVGNDGVCELRAYGFSPTARTFVFAISCDLTIYRRKYD
jgi:hypothetical protein